MVTYLRYFNILKQKPAVIPNLVRGIISSKLLRKDKVLRGAEFAVTYKCQGKCGKCSCLGLVDDRRQELTIEQILEASESVVKEGAILINITGGEPLLREDIFLLIKRLSRIPAILSLSTNGLLLNIDSLQELKDSGLNVLQISLNSPVKEEHDKIIGVDGSYDKVLSAIIAARKLGIEVLINSVITKEILHSRRMQDLIDIARSSRSFLSLVFPAKVGGWSRNEINLDQDSYQLIKRILKLRFVTTDTQTCYQKGVCPAGREKVYISAYGDVFPCPLIHNKQGNVLEGNFADIWKGFAYKREKGCLNIKLSDLN